MSTEKTPAQKKVRRLIDAAEEDLFQRISAYADTAPLTEEETIALLDSLGEADLAEKYGNWVMD